MIFYCKTSTTKSLHMFNHITDFQLQFKGRNAVNRDGIFYAISPSKENMGSTIEKSNTIARRGAYDHIALNIKQVFRTMLNIVPPKSC